MDFTELISSWVQEQNPSGFAYNVMLFGAAFWLVKKEVRKHFSSVEVQLVSIAKSMQDFTAALIRIETNHGMRIQRIEDKLNIPKEG